MKNIIKAKSKLEYEVGKSCEAIDITISDETSRILIELGYDIDKNQAKWDENQVYIYNLLLKKISKWGLELPDYLIKGNKIEII